MESNPLAISIVHTALIRPLSVWCASKSTTECKAVCVERPFK